MELLSTAKDKRTTVRRVERHIYNLAKTPPLGQWDIIGRVLTRECFSWRSEGSVPHIRHPNPWDLGKISLHNIWLANSMGLMSRNSKVLQETEIFPVGGLIYGLSCPETQWTKQQFEKHLDYMRGGLICWLGGIGWKGGGQLSWSLEIQVLANATVACST